MPESLVVPQAGCQSLLSRQGVKVCFRIIVKSGKEMQLFFRNPAGFADYPAFSPPPAGIPTV